MCRAESRTRRPLQLELQTLPPKVRVCQGRARAAQKTPHRQRSLAGGLSEKWRLPPRAPSLPPTGLGQKSSRVTICHLAPAFAIIRAGDCLPVMSPAHGQACITIGDAKVSTIWQLIRYFGCIHTSSDVDERNVPLPKCCTHQNTPEQRCAAVLQGVKFREFLQSLWKSWPKEISGLSRRTLKMAR